MTEPPIWSVAELAADAERAKAAFRTHRLREPLALYSKFFKAFAPIVADMVDRLPSLTGAGRHRAEIVADIIADDELRTAFRYLAAPPISEDDLKTLAETTLSATALRSDEAQARRVRETVLQVIDPHRFPWLADERSPTESERLQAIVSSAALIATRKVETARRSAAKNEQELAVKAMLLRAGLVEVPAREIPMLDAAPGLAEFCGECSFGGTRADLVVRLPGGRVAAIECKASNSAVNSYKRINHEALSKAHTWLEAFGSRQVVPIAVIDGVFNPTNLATAQSAGLTIIWRHRLDDLGLLVAHEAHG